MVNLAGFDLNLLVSFDALMTERNVSRAAKRVGLTQPAMSNVLRRMRGIFNDELFYRTSEGMMPSSTAVALAEAIAPALAQIQSGLDMQLQFDPLTTVRSFVIGMQDIGSVGMMPMLSRLLRRDASNLSVEVVNAGPDAAEKLVKGQIDMAVGAAFHERADLSHIDLARFPYLVVADRNNRQVEGPSLSIEDFVNLPHVACADVDSDWIDAALAKRGLKRRVIISVQYSQAVIPAILDTDLIAVLPGPTVQVSGQGHRLTVCPDPIGVPQYTIQVVWHRRHDDDAGHRWLREQIVARAREQADLSSILS